MVKTLTSNAVHKMRVMGGKRGTKHIGRGRSCVFHPKEKRCIGFIVKRPDLLWMVHRKDVFVGLDDFEVIDGHLVVHADAGLSGPRACQALGIDWDKCVIWEGMPLLAPDETVVGYVGNITFNRRSGAVRMIEANNGATSRLLLGALEVPADLVLGFKRGVGADLSLGNGEDGSENERVFKGAIMVSDEVWELSPEGGWAEAAGEFTAKAGARIKDAAANAKPKVEAVAKSAGEAVEKGAQAAGRQLEASKGMFSAFKEEYDKARHEGEEPAELAKPVSETEDADFDIDADANLDPAVDADIDGDAVEAADAETDVDADADVEAGAGESASPKAKAKASVKAPAAESVAEKAAGAVSRQLKASKGMFSAFKEEYDKARRGEE